MATSASTTPTFTTFYQNWLIEKQSLLHELDSVLTTTTDYSYSDIVRGCNEIVPRVLSHYQHFYNQKSNAANDDVCLILSPPWLTPFERSLLWISGFKPSILFRILDSVVTSHGVQLSNDKKQRIEAIKAETRRKEREITRAMARIQETVAEPPLYDLTRRMAKLVDGERVEFEQAMEGLKAAMLVVVNEADALRMSTAARVVEELDGVEGARFLAAAARFELQARKLGVEKECREE